MKPKHLIVGAVMTAFSLLALAAAESSPAATPPAGSTTATTGAAPKAAVKPVKKAKPSEQGKTRGLKSKKGKECVSESGCESGN